MSGHHQFKRLVEGLREKTRNGQLEQPMAKPACFSSQAEFDAWRREAQRVAAVSNSSPKDYCADCLPAYQAKMKLAGRCAHPDVTFVNDEGDIYGRRP